MININPKHSISLMAIVAAQWLCIPSIAAQEESFDCVINPKSTIKLGSAEDGILRELAVDRGDRVEKGALLASLDNEVERLSAELARLRAETKVEVKASHVQSDFHNKELARLLELRGQLAVSESVYDKADIEAQLAKLATESAGTEYAMAQVEYKRTKTSLERRNIRSPVDGVIVNIDMSPGEYVHEQVTLMTIAEVNPLNVDVFIPVAQYGNITVDMLAEVMPEQPVGGIYSAKVTVVDSVFDPASRTFGVRLELPNPNYLLPAGLRCTVQFIQ